MKLIDESKNTTATPSVSVSSSNGFMTLTGIFSLVKNRYYNLIVTNNEGADYQERVIADNGIVEALQCLVNAINVLDGSNVIYQDRVFVTSQTELDKYTVNEGVYTKETSYNNEYVII
tara:strand:- start:837 stop:1190 length:354 start_codon:yes stop_codon:yes gene_type:complete